MPLAFALLYDILGIPCFSSETVVRAAYKKLRVKYHPDSARYDAAPGMFANLRSAYSILNNDTQKAIHDATLRTHLNQAIIITACVYNMSTHHNLTIYTTDERDSTKMKEIRIQTNLSDLHWDESGCSSHLLLNVGFIADNNTPYKTNVYIQYIYANINAPNPK
jgi:curved DNA-binding protein CbpA